MKTLLTIATMTLATVLGAPGYAGDLAKTKTFDMTFDGFCDGMNLTLSNKVYIVGQSTGCSSGVDEGFLAKRGNINPYFDISSNNNGGDQALTYVFDDPRSANHGWCVYNTTDGVTQNVINCGTYTLGGRARRGAFPSSRYTR
ncbi:MAG TPA: hypothetical protein VHW69_04565 [Rhizomicrobium sp.]|jgi:hypothetical protein|nr:hypothetical protein [Rhizomicrobium sp.]